MDTPSKEALAAASHWFSTPLERSPVAIVDLAHALDSFAAAAVKREREKCAKVCDRLASRSVACVEASESYHEAAAEIRARAASEKE